WDALAPGNGGAGRGAPGACVPSGALCTLPIPPTSVAVPTALPPGPSGPEPWPLRNAGAVREGAGSPPPPARAPRRGRGAAGAADGSPSDGVAMGFEPPVDSDA